ncbi:MAG TPA: ABC transporter ATP-binding protein, partial [Candidatus Sulfotelmatobacter sp.]|nr:ABC transporter ATP-binding protein [Candidatus Sulfotelmatobacter sp.]
AAKEMGMMPPGSHGPVIWWGGWGGRRRKPETGTANSGLTGDPTLEPPQQPEGPKDLRGRWESLKQSVAGTTAALPQVLGLVWDASRPTTIGLFITTALAGLVPVISAGISMMLINAVVQGLVINRTHALDRMFLNGLGVPWLPAFAFNSFGMIVFLAVLQLVVFAVSALLNTLRNISQQLLQNSVSMRIQLMVMEKAASLDLQFYEDPASYDLLRRAQNDSINRPVLMIATVFGLLQTILTFITMIGALVVISPLLAGLALVSPVPAFIADTRYGWRGYNIARWGSRLLRRMTYLVTLVTTDSFAKEVKLFGLGGYFIERYRLIASAFYESQRNQVVRRYMTGFALGNLSTIVTSFTYVYVALLAIAGKLTVGHLSFYTQAAMSVQNSIQSILSGFSGMYEHNLYLNNLYELLAKEPAMPVSQQPTPVPEQLRGEIRFDHVTFAYPGAESNALTDLSFTIQPGETLAVVGRNGAGKTTLFKLICRLYDPREGRILIDGVDIKDFEPHELRLQIGAMFQDYVDYQATASENIGLGSVPEISDREAIVSASKQAGSDELISNLPAGYDTALGKWFDAGVNLSGGEWQKVALARAFMREEARILLLDEPTSALDAQAEYDLFERLRSLTHGRTAVYISHRFSTVRRADRIIFLEHGRLVEEGTHEELMRLDGRYARLFRMQAAAYTGEDVEVLAAGADVEVTPRAGGRLEKR